MNKQTWQTLAALGGVIVVGAAGIFGIQAIDQNRLTPTPEPTSAVSVEIVNGFAEAPTKPTPAPEPVVVEAPLADAPVAEEPVYEEPEPDYGIPIPWIADPNPNNTEGGYWDTTQCASGAGYQAEDGNQYCAP